jgi:Ca2+-binding RTX toxin-like protein
MAIILGAETKVNSYVTGFQEAQQITALAGGGWVATWQSFGQDGSGYGVYQQAYNADGSTLGGEVRVNSYVTNWQYYPEITALAGGGWVVTWLSLGQDGSDEGVYQQAYNADGSVLGGEVRVNSYVTGDQSGPEIMALAGGGWVVTWHSAGQDGSGYGVYQQAYNADGSTLGGEVRVNSYVTGHQSGPEIMALAGGGWVVNWTSFGRDELMSWGVYQQAYNADGSALGGEVRVNSYVASDQQFPQITALAGGGWVVTWVSEGQDEFGGTGVYQQAYNADGSALGGEVRVNSYVTGFQEAQQITALAGGGWVVTWVSAGQDGSGYGVYQQAYNADGSALGGEVQVNSYGTGNQEAPQITALADGGWVVTWQSADQDGSSWGVYQRIFHSGNSGTAGDDYLIGFDVPETLSGLAGNDTMAGNGGNDVLNGGDGDDTLKGGLGLDTLDGGVGLDTADYSDKATAVSVTLNGATNVVVTVGGIAEDTIRNIENVTGGFAADTLTGDALANTLIGNAGDDVLNGGDGDDLLTGGLGLDTLDGGGGLDYADYRDKATAVSVTLNGATNVVVTVDGIAEDTIRNIENVVGGIAADTLTGDALANVLVGNAGDDVLNGGDGDDFLVGGLGLDTLDGGGGFDYADYRGAAAGLTARLDNPGLNTEEAAGDFYIGIEGLIGSNFNDVLIGNGLANTLFGGAGNDTLNGGTGNDALDGGAGADNMAGGLGNDIYIIDVAGDISIENAGEGYDAARVFISSTLGANIERLELQGSGNLNGTGNTLNNTIVGNSGHNVLNGGGGNDVMVGGAGNDIYIVGSAGDQTIEAANGGTDTVRSYINWTLATNVERLELQGSGNLNGTGNTLANTLVGNSGANSLSGGDGNDFLNGGAGNDWMIGGMDDDIYIVAAALDQTIELAGQGTDTVRSYINWMLAENVERLELQGSSNLNGTGNTLNNTLVGNSGNNLLNGGAGNDYMVGGSGNDIYVVAAAGDKTIELAGQGTDTVRSYINWMLADNVERLELQGSSNLNGTGNSLNNTLVGNSGNNSLNAGDGNDYIVGGAGNDTLTGGVGNDRLIGGVGSDILNGGAGNDRFDFDLVSDSPAGPASRDSIVGGFSHGFDLIDLATIDANTLVGGDQAFSFIGSAAFSGVAGQLRYTNYSGNVIIDADVNGDSIADMQILVAGTNHMTGADFIL